MHFTAVFCSLLLCCAALPREQAKIEKRDADEDLEQLLSSIHRHHDDDDDDDRVYDKKTLEQLKDGFYSETDLRENRAQLNSITPAQATAIVDLHNKLRAAEGASNMEKLIWNPKLASLAQTWAQRCSATHGQPPFSPTDIGYKDLGQSYYSWPSPSFTVEKAVQGWFDEKKDYDYNRGDYNTGCASGKACGHYTALVWAKTTQVGCGLVYCPSVGGNPDQQLLFCNYAPSGNWQGEKPYVKGAPCSKCDSGKFFCNNNLCDSSCSAPGPACQCKAECKKCGTKTNDCKCNCPAGTMGPDCSEDCADKDPKCTVNGGYPEMTCNMPNFEFVKDKCPKMCKKCQPGTGKPCRKSSPLNALKRLMLGYLQSELDAEEESYE